MKKNILYLLSSYNRFTGTPKKTLDLLNNSNNNNFLYVWSSNYKKEFKNDYVNVSRKVFEGDYGRNIFKHVNYLIKIIDQEQIEIVQTQFFFGELLIGLVKLFRPKIKVIVVFVGSMSAGFLKRSIQNIFYKKVNTFVYISNYVKEEKEKVFSYLRNSKSIVIYNGTKRLQVDKNKAKKNENTFNLVSVSSLISIKNISTLIDMMELIIKRQYKDIHLYIAGSGAQENELKQSVEEKGLKEYVHFLGNQKKIGNLLSNSDIFVHPCYIEGFGISVIEAMMAEKPVVVSNAGALPEIVNHKKTGFLVNPFNAEQWMNAILELKNNNELSKEIAKNGRVKAEKEFSVKNFVENYNLLYQKI